MFDDAERDCCVVFLDIKLAFPRLIKVNRELSHLRFGQIRVLINAGHVGAAISDGAADRLAVASADINKPGAWFEREVAYEVME